MRIDEVMALRQKRTAFASSGELNAEAGCAPWGLFPQDDAPPPD